MTQRTRQWVAPHPGGPEVLSLVDVDLPDPGPDEVTIEVRAVGMNPADYKGFAGGDPATFPRRPGFEVAGVLGAVGPGTTIASGPCAVGDEVLAFRISGGYSASVTVPAKDVFAKPSTLGFPEAANLLLAGTTAAEMLQVTNVGAGDTVVLHGASGAVGVSVLQQARLLGVTVIGTAGEGNFPTVEGYGGRPVAYGDGTLARVRDAAPGGVQAALDAVGTDEAVDVSLALVDRSRIVTIAAFARAERDGFVSIGGAMPASAAFRDQARARLIALAASGDLEVPVARTFPFTEAREALSLLAGGHPAGKLALTT